MADKELVRERFEASFSRYNRLALVQQRICSELAQELGSFGDITVRRGLEIGAGTGFLTGRLTELFPRAQWSVNDLVPAAGKYLAKYLDRIEHKYLWGDAEELEFPEGLDLIATASTVQWFDDLPAFIAKTSRSTAEGGILALSTFGKGNFEEIRSAAGEGLEYYSRPELENMITGAGYHILSSREYTESLRFDTPVDVLYHIRATGVNSLRKEPWTKGRLSAFDTAYRERFPHREGGVSLTYHPILIIARKNMI